MSSTMRFWCNVLYQGVFFWSKGTVVRVLSDDWYVVRIEDRAIEQQEEYDQATEEGVNRRENENEMRGA